MLVELASLDGEIAGETRKSASGCGRAVKFKFAV